MCYVEQVITLPEESHDLRSARFYMLVIRGGTADLVGAVHFRQDQLQIDLFVFFSVFLAGFFLFVSVCVIIWQVSLMGLMGPLSPVIQLWLGIPLPFNREMKGLPLRCVNIGKRHRGNRVIIWLGTLVGMG